MASKRCKKTGESQTNFKIAKALALRSTLSKMCGFEEVIIIGNLEVEGLADEAAEAAAADANPKSESTSAPAFPGSLPGLLGLASNAASEAAGGGHAKAENEGGSSMTGGLESPGGATDDPEAGLKLGLASLEPAADKFTFILEAAAALSTIALKFMALEADSM